MTSKDCWTLIFQDEFDEPQFSERNYWKPNGTWLTGQIHADELQYYTRFNKDFQTNCDKGGNNYDQSNGTLKITTKWEPGNYEVFMYDPSYITQTNPTGFYTECRHYDYTSGWIETPEKFLYGYFEIKCKVPNQGLILWPAFWLWDGSGNRGEYREIDIFEFGSCQSNSPNYVGFNMHISRDLDNNIIQTPNNPINSYPDHYILPSGSVSNDFHTYGLRWTPNIVSWTVDGVEVYSVKQHTPHLEMRLIANMAIAPWCPPTQNGLGSNAFPFVFEIEHIRVYKSECEELMWLAGNEGKGNIAGWNMNPGDQFITGDFDNDGHDEILAISNKTDWAKVIKFNGSQWFDVWHNNGVDKIAGWYMNSGDQFIAGDFDNDGHDEILVISNKTNWAKVIKFNGSQWFDVWHNNGVDKIAGWYMNPGDQFIVGDFDNDNHDEILVISIAGWSKLLAYESLDWSDKWHNDGAKTIHLWHMNESDFYVGGNFTNSGKYCAIAMSASGWSQTLQFRPI
jgi:beta-glucanase (GH16 family)